MPSSSSSSSSTSSSSTEASNVQSAQPRRYFVLDVFASGALAGNPLAVVVDGEGLSTEQMQAYANWTNLSETVFLLPPTDPAADYRVRIFTPSSELPFAGHPTLGSCAAWLAAGNTPAADGVVVQECGVGLVHLRIDDDRAAFLAPPLVRSGPVDEATLDPVLGGLGLTADEVVEAAWVDNGPGWLALLLADADAVLAVRPPGAALSATGAHPFVGLVGFHPGENDAAYEVRAFFEVNGVTAEDPVTGSLNASVAQWLLSSGRVEAPYVATQGAALGRNGTVAITVEPGAGPDGADEVWVGGSSTIVVSGTVTL